MDFKRYVFPVCGCKAIIKNSVDTSARIRGRQRGVVSRDCRSNGLHPYLAGQLLISFSLQAHQYLYRKFLRLLWQDLPFWVLSFQ